MGRTWRNRARQSSWRGADKLGAAEHVYHASRCFGKLSYQTRAKAMRAKRNHTRKYGRQYRVYLCPYCNKYHLTTHPWTRWGEARSKQ